MDWILASASPRRKELLKEIVPAFEIIPSAADESIQGYSSPKQLVKLLAALKAEEVARREENYSKVVVGSDTVVAYKSMVLGKPQDEEDAKGMLKMLSGKKHHVYTGVCFTVVKDGVALYTHTAVEKTAVYFKKLSDEFIEEYVKSGSPMDKAGAYGIQDGGLVRKIKGSYTNVVGLPVELCKKMAQKLQGILKA